MPYTTPPRTLHEAEARAEADAHADADGDTEMGSTVHTPSPRLNRFERSSSNALAPSRPHTPANPRASNTNIVALNIEPDFYPPTTPTAESEMLARQAGLGKEFSYLSLVTRLGKLQKQQQEEAVAAKYGADFAAKLYPPSSGDLGFEVLSDAQQADIEFPPARPITKRKRGGAADSEDEEMDVDEDKENIEDVPVASESEMGARTRSESELEMSKWKVAGSSKPARSDRDEQGGGDRQPLRELFQPGDDDVFM